MPGEEFSPEQVTLKARKEAVSKFFDYCTRTKDLLLAPENITLEAQRRITALKDVQAEFQKEGVLVEFIVFGSTAYGSCLSKEDISSGNFARIESKVEESDLELYILVDWESYKNVYLNEGLPSGGRIKNLKKFVRSRLAQRGVECELKIPRIINYQKAKLFASPEFIEAFQLSKVGLYLGENLIELLERAEHQFESDELFAQQVVGSPDDWYRMPHLADTGCSFAKYLDRAQRRGIEIPENIPPPLKYIRDLSIQIF